ncbi:unnamed protein product [Mortierella alpina]
MSVPGSQPPYTDTNGPCSYPSSLASSFSSESSLFSSLVSLSAASSLTSSTTSLHFPVSKNVRTPVAAPTKAELLVIVPQHHPNSSYYSRPDPLSLPTNTELEQPKRTPRPPNSFILYRKEEAAKYSNLTAAELSKILGDKWARESPEKKAYYANLAKTAEQEHHLKYPEYKFTPAKRGTGKKARALRAAADSALKTAAVVAAASLAFDRDGGSCPLRSPRSTSRRLSMSSMSSMSSPPPSAVSPSVYEYPFSTTDNNALSPPSSRLLWQPSPLSPSTTSNAVEPYGLSGLFGLRSPPLSRRPAPTVPQYNLASPTPCSSPPAASMSAAPVQNHVAHPPQMLMAKVSSPYPETTMPNTASSLFFDPFVSSQWACSTSNIHPDQHHPSYGTSLAPESHFSQNYPDASASVPGATQNLRHAYLESTMDESSLHSKLSQLLRDEIVHMTMHDQNPALARFHSSQGATPSYATGPSQTFTALTSHSFVQDVPPQQQSLACTTPAQFPFSFAPPPPVPAAAIGQVTQLSFQALPRQSLTTPSRSSAPLISTFHGMYAMPQSAPPTPISPVTFNQIPMPPYTI